MSRRTKKILALAIQSQRDDQENIQGIANSSDSFGYCNIFNEVLSPKDVAQLIQDAEIVFEDDFSTTIPQEQPTLTPETSDMENPTSKETQENPQTHEINLIEEEVIISDINIRKYCDPEKPVKCDFIQDIDTTEEETVMENISSSDKETSLAKFQQQPDLTPEIVEMETSVSKDKQEKPHSHEINLIEEEIQADYNIRKYGDPEKTAEEEAIQNIDTLETETVLGSSSISDGETLLVKRKKSERKRELNNKLRMRGAKYIGFRKPKDQKNTFHDTPRDERRLKARCLCKDPSKQCMKFTDDDRKIIFSKFWSDMSWEQRKVFVATTVKVCSKKRPETENSRRSVTLRYHLVLKNTHLPVCKLMYLKTLSLGEWSVRSWALSANNGMVKSDEVEVSTRFKRKDIFKDDREFLEAFLTKLNKLPSHYCRKDTEQLYLEQTFQS